MAFIKRRKYEILIAVLLIALCILPLLFAKIYTGHDFKYHYDRIRCLADNIQNGKWFSPVYHSDLYEAGYASPAFYGDLFLYIPALMVCAGATEELALRLFIMIITVAAAYSAYFCAQKGFKKELPAFVCAVCFVFSSYFSVDASTRTALGELQTFIFLPLIALGFWSVLFRDGKYWLCLPLGLAGCLVSHVLTAAVCVIIISLFALCFIVKLIKEKQRFFALLKCVGVFIGVSAFFLLPLLEQLTSGEFVATNGMSAVHWGTLTSRSMPWYSGFCDFCMGSEATGAWIPNGLGLFPLVAMAFAVLVCIKLKRVPLSLAVFTGCGLFTLLLTTKLFPWSRFQSLAGGLQFPWRLLAFATLFFALLAGTAFYYAQSDELKAKWSPEIVCFKEAGGKEYAVRRYSFKKILIPCVAALAVGLSLFSYVHTSYEMYGKMRKKAASGDEIAAPGRDTIGAGEYLPVNEDTFAVDENGKRSSDSHLITCIKSVLRQNSKKAVSNNLKTSSLKLTRGYGELTVEFSGNRKDDTYITVPLINYKGYAAYINGERVEVSNGVLEAKVKISGVDATYSASFGSAVRVYVGDIQSGTLTVRYEGTAIQLTGKLITILTLFAGIALFILKTVRSRSQKNTRALKAKG